MRRITRHLYILFIFALAAVGFGLVSASKAQAASGPCANTEFGYVSYNNISMPGPGAGNYRVWARIKMPTGSTNNNFKLEVDGANCYTMGGASVPSNQWTWVDFETNNAKVTLNNFAAGPHNFRAVGTGEGLLLDRVIFTQDTAAGGNCGPPQGTGNDCADPPDTTPPVINLTGPAASPATIKDTVNVTATASDNGTIAKIDFFVDGVDKGDFPLSSGSPYSFSWNTKTSGVSDGPHTIKVRVTDGMGLTSESSRSVIVANGKPDLRVTAIGKSPAVVNAGVPVTFNATIKNYGSVDSVPGNVEFSLTNSQGNVTILGTATSSNQITGGGIDTEVITLSSPTWTSVAGSWTVTAKVDSGSAISEAYSDIDAEANNTLTQNFTVGVVDNTDPVVDITYPSGGDTLTGSKTLTATATDIGGTGVSSVVFYDGIAQLGTGVKTGTNYGLIWDTKTTGNGSHVIKAVATDAKGNTSEDTVTITVDNQVVSASPWDMDGDNDVDMKDVLKFRRNWLKSPATREEGDFDGNNKVDLRDFLKFNKYWTGPR